jgi:hypothetical protein
VEKRKIIKLSLIISVLSLFIFSFTYFGNSAIGFMGSANKVFSENTLIGNVDVSGKSHEDAKLALEAKRSEWASNAELKLTYKDQTLSVAPSDYLFLIDESISSAVNGVKNDLLVDLKKDLFDEIPIIPTELSSSLDKESLRKELLLSGQNFVQSSEISLEDYLPQEEPVVISTGGIQLAEENHEVLDFLNAYPSIEIAPETQFSLAALVQDSELANLSSYTYSQIAAVIYQAIQPTNFSIAERHISSQLPSNIEAGFEAKVNLAKKMDFIFYNPNKSSYTIEFKLNGPELEVSIIGVPLIYNYNITTADMKEFKPRTIKQFSPLLEHGQKSVEVEGSPGILVKVYRETYNLDGELLKTEMLSEDFYPPVHRVEILALTPATQESAAGEDGSPDTISSPSSGETIPSDESASDMIPSDHEENVVGEQHPNGIQTGTGNIPGEDDDGLFGKPNEEPK